MTLIDIEIDRNANPVDEIEQLAHANDWTFERSSEEEITVSVAGHWCEYHVSFTWMDEFESLHLAAAFDLKVRSEERRVGKECRIGCRSRWSPYH